MLDIFWIADDDGRRQRRHTDLKGGEAGLVIGTNKPIEQLVSRLKEP